MNRLRFTIPELDALFGRTQQNPSEDHVEKLQSHTNARRHRLEESPEDHVEQLQSHAVSANPPFEAWGLQYPESPGSQPPITTSLCISGPTGTGKSILGLHLASAYLHDFQFAPKPPVVIYFSTDLTYDVARFQFNAFFLHNLVKREIPFFGGFRYQPQVRKNGMEARDISLNRILPEMLHEDKGALGTHLRRGIKERDATDDLTIAFVDLASRTSGDDWSFIDSVISLLQTHPGDTPHLVVVDSTSGLHQFGGTTDRFGAHQEKENRLDQLLRVCKDRCHLVLIAQDSLPEAEPVEVGMVDHAIRLRSREDGATKFRSIEVIKTRTGAHVRGEHQFVSRNGSPGNTGSYEWPDMPACKHSYLLVLHSLDYLGSQLAEPKYYPLVGNGTAQFRSELLDTVVGRGERLGIRRGLMSALIGDENSHKARIGREFLAAGLAHGERALYLSTAAMDSEHLWDRFHKLIEEKNPDLRGDVHRKPREEILKWNLLYRCCEVRNLNGPLIAHIVRQMLFKEQRRILVKHFGKKDGVPKEDHDPDRVPKEDHDPRAYQISKEQSDAILKLRSRLVGFDEDSVARAEEVPAQLWKLCKLDGEPDMKVFDCAKDLSRIRFVIDDLSLIKSVYRVFEKDSLLLPYLVRFLVSEGVTTLICDTQPGDPKVVIDNEFDREVRAYCDRITHTWHVKFFGENKVAITSYPSMGLHRSLVYEVSLSKDSQSVVLDPHFEMYLLDENGNFTEIPLKVSLHDFPSLGIYAKEANRLLKQHFRGQEADILNYQGEGTYDYLREIATSSNRMRWTNTYVVAVDEFWSRGGKCGLADMSEYLTSVATEQSDPFRVHRQSKERRHSFDHRSAIESHPVLTDPKPVPHSEKSITGRHRLVPFTWDFGFLLVHSNLMEELERLYEQDIREGGFIGSRRGPCSWRNLLRLESTLRIGRHSIVDLDCTTRENLTCFFLEVLYSFLREDLNLSGQAAHADQRGLDDSWANLHGSAKDVAGLRGTKRTLESLLESASGGGPADSSAFVAITETLLFLALILPVDSLVTEESFYRVKRRPASKDSLISRHWYSTACSFAAGHAQEEFRALPLLGSFSTRGDWFLGVAEGSASLRLGFRAIDLLTSQAGNATRLLSGVGLPVRGWVDKEDERLMRTGLEVGAGERRERLSLQQVTELSQPVSWLWRSSLVGYDRYCVILSQWILKMLVSISAGKCPHGVTAIRDRYLSHCKSAQSSSDGSGLRDFVGQHGDGLVWLRDEFKFLMKNLMVAKAGRVEEGYGDSQSDSR